MIHVRILPALCGAVFAVTATSAAQGPTEPPPTTIDNTQAQTVVVQPIGFLAVLDDLSGSCWIVVPAPADALLGNCVLPNGVVELRVWKGPPVSGGIPAAVLPYSFSQGQTFEVPDPTTASLLREMKSGTLYLQLVGAAGVVVGQGQILPPHGQSSARVMLNGASHQPPSPTTATGSCDVLLMRYSTGGDFHAAFFDCAHTVQNATLGQLRRDSPDGSVIVDFSDQVSNPRQRGIFFPQSAGSDVRAAFLNGQVYAAIDESSSGARIAGRVGPCWNGEQAANLGVTISTKIWECACTTAASRSSLGDGLQQNGSP